MHKILQILDISSIKIDSDFFNLTAVNSQKDPYWVDFIKDGFEHANVKIEILPFEKINLDKKWLINVDIKQWLWNSDTILSDFFDEGLIHEIKLGNAYLILNHQCESWTHSFFRLLHKILKKDINIPANKIIYMVAAVDVVREYEKFINENNITDKINLIYCHHVYKRFHRDTDLSFFDYKKSNQKSKKFLCLNRRWHDHRLVLVSMLSHRNLLDQGFVSLGLEQNELGDASSRLLNLFEKNSDIITGFEKIKHRLPLNIDDVDLKINHFGLNTLPIDFYQRSCFSVVTSTNAFEYQELSAGFTEKEIKPILARHPFIILNRPGILKEMQRLGFLTFSPWFDESYDAIENDNDRLISIANEIERLCQISFDEWEKMLDQMSPILEHNYHRLIDYNNEHCFYNSDLKKLLYYVD